MNTYKNDPRRILVKYTGKCARCQDDENKYNSIMDRAAKGEFITQQEDDFINWCNWENDLNKIYYW